MSLGRPIVAAGRRSCFGVLAGLYLATVTAVPAAAEDAAGDSPVPPLLPGYRHEKGPSRDSISGTISKAGGPRIFYEYGGNASFDGNLKAAVPKGKLQWYKEYATKTRLIQLAMQKDKVLKIGFGIPRLSLEVRGITSDEHLAEVLLMAWGFAPPLLTQKEAVGVAQTYLKRAKLSWGKPQKVTLLKNKLGFWIHYDTPVGEIDRVGPRVVSVNRWNKAVGILPRR